MNEKKAEVTRVLNGMYSDVKRPQEKAPGASLGIPDGSAGEAGDKEQKEAPPPTKVREAYELQEQAWKLMDQAVSEGRMVLESGAIVTLNADSLIRVIQWLASAKAKKPHLINPPEDFKLKETTSG
ncbi:hypothetical protein LCGC14_2193110 [marine sediment metagenome]|uniref:Uncharacterized protein n=1 Tax=marine sediment metagenome TaxID=412755 RepID=A0A0F9DIY5_9ZZZZ